MLSQLQGSPGTEVFLEVARAAGHDVTLVNPLRLLHVAGRAPALPLDAPPDAVFTRMGSATPERGFDVLRGLELAGLPCVNRSAPLRVTRDKTRAYLELAAAGLPLPATVLAAGDADARALQAELGPPPWVLKDPIGTKGNEVRLVPDADALTAELDALGLARRAQLQRFVREAGGRDLRVFVVGGRAVAGVERRAAPGEWRSNLHQGGSAHPAALDARAREVAESCARVLDLDVCGVDLLPSEDGPLVAEVNGSPGLAGLRTAHGDAPVHAVLALLAERVSAARGARAPG
ncbi:MAG: RimK family alpha-L-glutamate ligase [Planctomycetes bacterium]|nr:RimK family alpha-L-glutamate ligase [Planctomycetota bacterium]